MGEEQRRPRAVPVLRRRHIGRLDDAGRSMGHPNVTMSATVLPLVLASSRRRSDTKVDPKDKKSSSWRGSTRADTERLCPRQEPRQRCHHRRGRAMSVTTVHQPTKTTPAMFVALAVAILAIALAIALPLLLRSTKTVIEKVSTPTTSSSTSTPSSYDPQTLREAHGG